MRKKSIIILILFVLMFAVSNTPIVSAQETDVPVIEEVSFTDGGAAEIDTIEMSAPISIEAGDLLIMIMCSDNAADAVYFEAVVGWTKLGESGNSVCDTHIAVYYQIGNGSEIDTTVTGVAVSNMLGWILRISGVDTSDAIEDSNFAASTASGTNPQVVPTITTLKDNCLVLYGLSFDGGDGYPMTTAFPFIELSDRTNTGTPTEAYVAGTFGYRNLENKGLSGDAYIYTANVDGAAYFQLAINGDIASTATTGSGLFYDLFLTTSIGGLVGPFALLIVGFFLMTNRKYKPLGGLWLILELVVIAQYFTLLASDVGYWWHIILLSLGVVVSIFQSLR